MLTYKTSKDFEKMAKAGKVVSNIHYEIYNSTKPGMTLKDLDKIAKNRNPKIFLIGMVMNLKFYIRRVYLVLHHFQKVRP